MTTKRKPYVREMKSSWWKELAFYKHYIIRESTSLAAVWFSLLLFVGFCSLLISHSSTTFIEILQNPIVFLLNVISLVAMLFHAKTWFELAPKAANVIVKGEKLAPAVQVKALWIVTAIVSLIILLLALI